MSLHLSILLLMAIFSLTAPSLEPIFPNSPSSQLITILHAPFGWIFMSGIAANLFQMDICQKTKSSCFRIFYVDQVVISK